MAAAVRALYPDGVDAVIDAALLGPGDPAARSATAASCSRSARIRASRDGKAERDITVHLVLVGQHLHEGHRIAELAGLVSEGVLTLRVADVLPAERAAEAHRRLEAGGVRGRLVLTF